MRFSEIVEDTSDIKSIIIDIISVASAEGMTSLSIDTLHKSLAEMGNEVDHSILFDLLDSIPIVDNIKDDVIFFGRDDSSSSEKKESKKPDEAVAKPETKDYRKLLFGAGTTQVSSLLTPFWPRRRPAHERVFAPARR